MQDQCAFNGAWGGNATPTAFYVSSYFWDRAADAGIIGEKSAITWTLKPDDFSSAASVACSSTVAALAGAFPYVRPAPPSLLGSLARGLTSLAITALETAAAALERALSLVRKRLLSCECGYAPDITLGSTGRWKTKSNGFDTLLA